MVSVVALISLITFATLRPSLAQEHNDDKNVTGAGTEPVEPPVQDSEEARVEEWMNFMKSEHMKSVTSAPTEWNCSRFDCEPTFTDKEDENPLLIRTSKIRPIGENNCTDTTLFAAPTDCLRMVGGNQCGGGGRCLEVDNLVDYCICPYQRAGTSCHIEKEGKCKETTGQIPSTVLESHRYVHKNDKHIGSIVARHFAPSLEHCIRLCEWSGRQRCRSVNFGGNFSGESVCELLSVWAPPGSVLQSWVEMASGWTYACCFR